MVNMADICFKNYCQLILNMLVDFVEREAWSLYICNYYFRFWAYNATTGPYPTFVNFVYKRTKDEMNLNVGWYSKLSRTWKMMTRSEV